jgi:phytanoyl-CoA hydroxylase
MLSAREVASYHERGYVVVPDVLTPGELAEVRRAVDEIVEGARSVTKHDGVYDLEEGHSPEAPRVRRIKAPHRLRPVFDRIARHPKVTGVLADLIGPNIRLHNTKLNMKWAGYGSGVEWHQDWAFYPHTNDDVLATGIYLDDCDMENGPLMVIPGTHEGPVYDHHANGRFCGAIDVESAGLDISRAVPLTGKAGTMTVHHARLLHGSVDNRSGRPRRLLLHEYAAADAWPLLGVTDFDDYERRIVLGRSTIEPRVVPAPIRMPFPAALNQGSIFENQKGAARRYYTQT